MSSEMFRAAVSYLVDPEADEVHSWYENGNVRSVRDARREGLYAPVSPDIIFRERSLCAIATLAFAFVTLLILLFVGTSGRYDLSLVALISGWFSYQFWRAKGVE